MKNIFFVINKEKVYAYIVSILTIVILFFMSSVLNSDFTSEKTSANIEQNTDNNLVIDQRNSENALVSNENIIMEKTTNKSE